MSNPVFWRDEALPFIEARSIQDARGVCYAPHAHETLSIGAIIEGRCDYMNRGKRQRISTGTVVLMNPGDVHACNPIRDQPWAYHMLYWDTAWVAEIQYELCRGNRAFRRFAASASTDVQLFSALNRLVGVLYDPQLEHLEKHESALNFIIDVQRTLGTEDVAKTSSNPGVRCAADFIREHCTQSLKLKDICSAANLSASYLIRAFKSEYGMSPHAYLVNCRIELSRQQLRRGRPLAEVAIATGFSDQAHLQRSFKKLVAATPGQYKG